jgi:hypothetical protein
MLGGRGRAFCRRLIAAPWMREFDFHPPQSTAAAGDYVLALMAPTPCKQSQVCREIDETTCAFSHDGKATEATKAFL